MNRTRLTIQSLFLLTLLITTKGNSQVRKPFFLGIQPAITQEQFYPKGEFDVNVFPFVYQRAITKQIDFRLTSVVNYHFGSIKGFSDIGVDMIVPYFFTKKQEPNLASYGFYLGPVFALGNNNFYDHGTVTIALEPGYMFYSKKRFTLSLGMQLGASYFLYYHKENAWHNHFGAKINLGFWFQK